MIFEIENGVLRKTHVNASDTSISFPNNVVSIADDAFPFCGSVTSISIPDCVSSIVTSAFNRC